MSMTETTSPLDDPQVQTILGNMRALSLKVKEIDNELGTEDSGPIALRNRLASELVSQNAVINKDQQGNITVTAASPETATFAEFLNKIVGAIDATFSGTKEMQAAMYSAIHDVLGKKYGAEVKSFLDGKVKETMSNTPKVEIPLDRKEKLLKDRSAAATIFKLQSEILKQYDVLTLPADIEVPSQRKGAIGPRGATFPTYQFYVGDEASPRTVSTKDKDGNKIREFATLSQICSTVCKDLNWKTKDLKDFIVKELDLKIDGATDTSPGAVDPGNEFVINLPEPVGKKLRGVKVTSTTAPVSPEDDDDDDDDDNGEAPNEDDAFTGV